MAVSTWQTLPFAYQDLQIPPLFVRYEITSSSYTVHVTDLTRIWTESIDRRMIIRRGIDKETSIDPSEGPDQLKLLLHHVRKALDSGINTSLTLTSIVDQNGLRLDVLVGLPEPIQPLEWEIYLGLAPEESLTSEIVLPLMNCLNARRAEVLSVIAIVQEKDHVISRLTEKLQTAGIGLSDVFPGASPSKASKAVARDSVMNTVKGLKEFDEDAWRRSIPQRHQDNSEEFFCNFFQSNQKLPEQSPLSPTRSYGKWWENIGLIKSVMANHNPSQESKSSPEIDGQPLRDEKEFQRQTAPDNTEAAAQTILSRSVHQEPCQSKNAADRVIEESTDSETDDDLEASALRGNASSAIIRSSPSKPAPKLGAEERKSNLEPPLADLGIKELTEGDDAIAMNTSPPQTTRDDSKMATTPPRLKGKLGKIGGRRVDTKSTIPSAEASESFPSARGNGPSIASATFSPRAIPERFEQDGRSVKQQTTPISPARAASEERADRNRSRLRRELEEKRKAPVRKKRKF